MVLALFDVRGYLTRLTGSWYLICVGSLTLYALTATWDKLWATGVVVSAEAFRDVSDGAARAGLDWNAC